MDEVDAVEVDGDVVSHADATGSHQAVIDSEPSGSGSGAPPLAPMHGDNPDELSEKMKRAWSHLKQNEIEDALTLAQEVVWEHPSLVEPKLIIARCFINRKEYEKALNILQAIPDAERNAESMYYLGLCQSRQGRVREAIRTLTKAKAAATEPLLRKRSTELITHLQGEQTVCPKCGKKTLYESMVDVGDQTVCANCARSIRRDDGEDDGDADVDDRRKRRRRLRPPLTKTDVAIRVLFVVLLLGMFWSGLYVMSLVLPAQYASIRSYLPNWTRLPSPQPPAVLAQRPTPHVVPRVVPTLIFDSPPVGQAISGVELRHRAFINDMDGRRVAYSVSIFPQPEGKHQFDTKTGLLVWTPTQGDAGKNFEISFAAAVDNHRAREQINSVFVSSGPVFGRVAFTRPPDPGETRHLVVDDLDADGRPDVVVLSGMLWDGAAAVFSDNGTGEFSEVASGTLPGRPVGAGVVMAGDEKWVAVADYWNSRLRYYALRGGSFSEMAMSVDLPGQPLLAAFDTATSTSAFLCRGDQGNRVLVYRQKGQLHADKLGEWTVPDDFVWRRILVLPGDIVQNREVRLLLVGGDAAESLLVMDPGDSEAKRLTLNVHGRLLDADVASDGHVYCLVERDGSMFLTGLALGRDGTTKVFDSVPAGAGAALGGFLAVNFSTSRKYPDLIVLSTSKVGLSFPSGPEEIGGVFYWPLPDPALLMGGTAIIPPYGDHGLRAVYFDAVGAVRSVGMSTPPPEIPVETK